MGNDDNMTKPVSPAAGMAGDSAMNTGGAPTGVTNTMPQNPPEVPSPGVAPGSAPMSGTTPEPTQVPTPDTSGVEPANTGSATTTPPKPMENN